MLGNRIQRARKALGLSLRDLAEQVALSHAAIKKYEDNKVMPSSDILLRLSKALHVKAEYFFRPTLSNLKKIQFRNHKSVPRKNLEQIKFGMLDQIERRIELEDLFPISPIKEFSTKNLVEKINYQEDIEVLAEKVRKYWNLGLDPILDIIDLFEEHGIKVFEINNELYNDQGFDGLSADINDMPVIVIGNKWPGDRQRFTLAHELGHLLLDNKSLEKVEFEEYCDHFAGAFLLPKKALIAILGKHRNHIEPRELSLIKQEFGISMLGVLHRALDAKIISNNVYKELRTEFNKRGWDKEEPGEQYPQEKTHIFEQMIFHALAEDYIGESKAAELMNIPLEKLRSLRAMENSHAVLRQ